jgi:hypothetical protein
VIVEIDVAELEQALRIEKNDLDNAILTQPEIFYQVASAFVEARDQMDAIKDEVDLVDSRLALEFRELAERKQEKLTEARVASMVITDQDHIDVVARYRAAKLQAEKLGALRDAFNQRSSMLRELTSLYVSEYFTRSSMSGPANRTQDVNAARGREAMASRRQSLKLRKPE